MRILIVDDDPVILKALEIRLTKEGYEVTTTLDPNKALDILKDDEEEQYDLIISDIVMPYISGIELLVELKTLSPHSPIILMSALDQKELILTAFEMGAQDFVVKPINIDELLLRLKKYTPNQDAPQS